MNRSNNTRGEFLRPIEWRKEDPKPVSVRKVVVHDAVITHLFQNPFIQQLNEEAAPEIADRAIENQLGSDFSNNTRPIDKKKVQGINWAGANNLSGARTETVSTNSTKPAKQLENTAPLPAYDEADSNLTEKEVEIRKINERLEGIYDAQ